MDGVRQTSHCNRTARGKAMLFLTNDDLAADYIAFYSGNATTTSYRPTLIIEYYVP